MNAPNLAPVTIKGVCLDAAGRVLLCRNDRLEWELPGGRPELGEAFPACLIREIREETGLTAKVQELIDAYPYEVLPGRWVTVIVYGCEIREAREPLTSDEHGCVAFLDPDGLSAQNVAEGYRRAIAARLKLS